MHLSLPGLSCLRRLHWGWVLESVFLFLNYPLRLTSLFPVAVWSRCFGRQTVFRYLLPCTSVCVELCLGPCLAWCARLPVCVFDRSRRYLDEPVVWVMGSAVFCSLFAITATFLWWGKLHVVVELSRVKSWLSRLGVILYGFMLNGYKQITL